MERKVHGKITTTITVKHDISITRDDLMKILHEAGITPPANVFFRLGGDYCSYDFDGAIEKWNTIDVSWTEIKTEESNHDQD